MVAHRRCGWRFGPWRWRCGWLRGCGAAMIGNYGPGAWPARLNNDGAGRQRNTAMINHHRAHGNWIAWQRDADAHSHIAANTHTGGTTWPWVIVDGGHRSETTLAIDPAAANPGPLQIAPHPMASYPTKFWARRFAAIIIEVSWHRWARNCAEANQIAGELGLGLQRQVHA